jgi:SAM-dependent methyltransferase
MQLQTGSYKFLKYMITKFNIEKDLSVFGSEYVKIRTSESRMHSIEEIKNLPNVKNTHPHLKEWQMRTESFNRFENYVSTRNFTSILDIACGNGWMLNRLSSYFKCLDGIDVNLTELEQAQIVLSKHSNSNLYHGNILDIDLQRRYDLISIVAGIQYFSSFQQIMDRCLDLLLPNGEIHIYDSPFYTNRTESEKARTRTKEYYQRMNANELGNYYHHHLLLEITYYNASIKYNPRNLRNRLNRKLGLSSNPFPWIVIPKAKA